MPRAPKFLHPFRAAREALSAFEGREVSQAQFAKRLGISTSYLQKIELGKIQPPPLELCGKIERLTGANLDVLHCGEGELVDYDGEPISGETIKAHIALRRSETWRAMNAFSLRHAEIALRAAGKAASGRLQGGKVDDGDRLDAFLIAFEEWLVKTINDFGLAASFRDQFVAAASAYNKNSPNNDGPLLVWPAPMAHSTIAGRLAYRWALASHPIGRRIAEESHAEIEKASRYGITHEKYKEAVTKSAQDAAKLDQAPIPAPWAKLGKQPFVAD